MAGTPKSSTRHLVRLILFTLIAAAAPSIAYADAQTKMGLENVANSIAYLAVAIAFAGIVIAIAIALYPVIKSRHRD